MAWGQWYVWVFAALLAAYALNSNWWLQAQQRFAPAVGFAALGVMASACVVYALVGGHVGGSISSQGAWLVLVLVLPQVCVGVGTWWVARVGATQLAKLTTGSPASLSWLRTDAPLVASQLLLLASTTLGTVVVCGLADASTTAAYAATEKLFNLVATVLVGLYMALYPRLAGLFYSNRGLYWRTTHRLLLVCVGGGLLLAAVLALVGPVLLGWYMPAHMVALVAPVLWPLGLWLGLCISQHVLTSHLVLAECKHMVLWANACVLLATVVVGYACALSTPVAWVNGMVTGQVLALVWLLRMCRQDKATVA
jgi:O-antigen/teichoic acid export membrane protein